MRVENPQAAKLVKRFIILLLLQSVSLCVGVNIIQAEVVERPQAGQAAVPGADVQVVENNRTRLKVMTFNIRWQGNDEGKFIDSGFSHRKPLVLDVLNKFGADIVGLQEASIEQRGELAPGLPQFSMFPSPGEAGDECILFLTSRFILKDSGYEGFRRIPEISGVKSWGIDFVWVRLEDRISGKNFYLVNHHMLANSPRRWREVSAVLTGEWIENRKFDDPVILIGDFNGQPREPRYLYLTGQRAYANTDGVYVKTPMPMLDTFRVANPDAEYSGTVNRNYNGKKNNIQIDYVFVPRGTEVIDSRIIYYHGDGNTYPSDHFPLLSEFEF